MNALWRRMTFTILQKRIKQEIGVMPLRNVVNNLGRQNGQTPVISLLNVSNFIITRHKSKKQKDSESDDEQEVFDDEDRSLSKDSKVVNFKTTSLRADVILKLGLGVSRNKIEQVFYESKLRLNGKKIMKKSHSVKVGSELDIIKSVSPQNPDHIYISRVEVLNIVPKEESIAVTVRRFKNLLIENYEDDPYKPSSADNE